MKRLIAPLAYAKLPCDIAGLVCMVVLALTVGQVFAQSVSLYDNRAETLGFSPEAAGFPQNPMTWLAQPFSTGEHDNVASVTINFRQALTASHASGNLSVEIWDDSGTEIPGSLVGVIGLVDVGQLTDEWELVTLDGPVHGLAPQSTFHVVVNPSDTNVTTERSFRVAFYETDEGTFGAGNALVDIGNGWGPIRDRVGNVNFSYLQMAVTANSTIPEPSSLVFLMSAVVAVCSSRRLMCIRCRHQLFRIGQFAIT